MAQAVTKSEKPVHRVHAVGVHRPIEDRSFLSVIAAAAADPKCDVAKMQALLDMQRQVEDREAVKAFTRDFIELQDVLPVINRDGKIEIREKDGSGQRNGRVQQATPYSTYPNIMKICKPIMKQHGFGFGSWIEPEPGGARIMVVSQLDHIEHHHRVSRFPLPAETSGSKNNVQGWGSSQQYGMRYNAIALLNIISEFVKDQDKDGFPGDFNRTKDGGLVEKPVDQPKVTKKQVSDIEGLLVWAGVPEARFCEKYGIAGVQDLPAELFAAAEKEIKDYQAQKAKR